MNNEQSIRNRAYEIWEAEGRPDGKAEQHWMQALAEIGDTGEVAHEHNIRTTSVNGSVPQDVATEGSQPAIATVTTRKMRRTIKQDHQD